MKKFELMDSEQKSFKEKHDEFEFGQNFKIAMNKK